jgi:hypothetical protein
MSAFAIAPAISPRMMKAMIPMFFPFASSETEISLPTFDSNRSPNLDAGVLVKF